MKRILAAAMMAALAGGMAQAGEGPAGVWRMTSGKVTVRISDCGGDLCGTIVGLKKPLDKHGQPKRDKDNPNKALRNRPVIGLTILSNMRPSDDNSGEGTIYNPDDGNTYKSRMVLKGSDTMKVDGCVMVLCKSMTFIRVQ